MSANRYLLIPEDLWKGMISSRDTGDSNLDFARRAMESVRHENMDPTTKNALYNQELRRYLHLQKEHENRPVKVEVTAGLSPESTPEPDGKPAARKKTKKPPLGRNRSPKTPKTPKKRKDVNAENLEEEFETQKADPKKEEEEEAEEQQAESSGSSAQPNPETLLKGFTQWLKVNQRFGVLKNGQIMSDSGYPVKNSDINASLKWLAKDKLIRTQLSKPLGTNYLENRLKDDQEASEKLKIYRDAQHQQGGKGHFSKLTSKLQNRKSGFAPQLWKQY